MPKKSPNRTTDASCFVRMPSEDREIIEKAIDKLLAQAPMPMRLGVGSFMLAAAVEKAKAILAGR